MISFKNCCNEDFTDMILGQITSLNSVGSYKKYLNNFRRWSNATKDPILYRCLGSREYGDLANFALQLAVMPAVIPKLNLPKLYHNSLKRCQDCSVEEYAPTFIVHDKETFLKRII